MPAFSPPSLSVSHWNNLLLKWFFKVWSSETWGLAKFLVVEIKGEVKRLELQDPFHIHSSPPHLFLLNLFDHWDYTVIYVRTYGHLYTHTHTHTHTHTGTAFLWQNYSVLQGILKKNIWWSIGTGIFPFQLPFEPHSRAHLWLFFFSFMSAK